MEEDGVKQKPIWPLLLWVLVGAFVVFSPILILFVGGLANFNLGWVLLFLIIACLFLLIGVVLVVSVNRGTVTGLLGKSLRLVGFASIAVSLSFGCILFHIGSKEVFGIIMFASLAGLFVGIVATIALIIKNRSS